MKAAGKKINENKIWHNANDQSQLSAICYAIRGFWWNPHIKIGGMLPLLSPKYLLSLKLDIESNCVNLDCLRTYDGI